MTKHWIPLLTVSWLLLTSAAASAQEKGRTGLTMAFPASVGLIWHVSDHVAIRPEVSFSWSKTSSDSSSLPITSSLDGSSVAVGLAGLFYVGKWEGLSAYVSPRFSYARVSTTVTTTIEGGAFIGVVGPIPRGALSVSSSVSEITSSTYSASGSFGAQYSLSRKFGVFGEAGLGYTDQRSSGSSTHAFGTRSGVGVIFYF